MGKLHFGSEACQALKLSMQPRCSLTNCTMCFVKCEHTARRPHVKRMTMFSKLPVKKVDLRHIATYQYIHQNPQGKNGSKIC